MQLVCILAVVCGLWAFSPDTKPTKPHVVFVTGDDEYRSEITMPLMASILEARHGLRCTVLFAKPSPKTKENIPGLEALKTADLAVFFLRWRTLPDDQMQHILDYLESGKPLVGLRTTTHSFLYPSGHRHAKWNDGFGRDVFGQKWLFHYGHESSTDATVDSAAAEHPVLRGVKREFHVRSWLYHVVPLYGESQPLVVGRAVATKNTKSVANPVAWVKMHNGARVFFTTMGHPEDFSIEAFRKLLINGILWTLDKPIAMEGADATIDGNYKPPPTH